MYPSYPIWCIHHIRYDVSIIYYDGYIVYGTKSLYDGFIIYYDGYIVYGTKSSYDGYMALNQNIIHHFAS